MQSFMNPHLHFSRREFLTRASLGLAATALSPLSLLGGETSPVITMRASAADAKILVHKLRNNISVLEGSGGNIGVLVGSEGKLLVDAGITASRPRLQEALKSMGKEPVQMVINTHWHFDHTDGNEWLQGGGAKIVAHENTRKRMAETTRVDAWNFTFPPSPKGALPTQVFPKELPLTFNGSAIALKYYGPSHTDTDICVEFSDADIFQTGDTWWNGHFPFIDYSTGGSIDGAIRAAEANIARAGKKTLIIPGHGPVGGKSDLEVFRDMLVSVREKVAALKRKGLTLDEIKAAAPTAAYDKTWGGFVINGKAFTSLVYAGV
jgi:glyoxylase-like metal-dependent hydrolase (beta-lactamase superfamily II)